MHDDMSLIGVSIYFIRITQSVQHKPPYNFGIVPREDIVKLGIKFKIPHSEVSKWLVFYLLYHTDDDHDD